MSLCQIPWHLNDLNWGSNNSTRKKVCPEFIRVKQVRRLVNSHTLFKDNVDMSLNFR